MTTIQPGQKLTRLISIPGIDKPVTAEITYTGISFWVKGHRKRVRVTWTRTVEAGNTSEDVPSFLMGKPLELLQHQAAHT
jgi:hypothetical protein